MEWKKVKLSKYLEEVIDYRGKTPPKSSQGIPLISAATVKSGKLDFTKDSYISEEDFEEWATRGFIKSGDVLITTEAPAGEVAILPNDQTYQLSRRVMALRTIEEELSHQFLFYYFLNPRTNKRLLQANRGSTVPRLLKTDITEFEIELPTHEVQLEVSKTLQLLDAKIDLLRQQNETLEALGATVFREWFLEGNWGQASLYDQIELVGGGTPKTGVDEYWGGNIGWLSGGDIASNHKGYVIEAAKEITETGVANSSAKLLPRNATVISARGTVGKYCLLAEPMAFSQSNYGVLPADSESFYFTYLLIDHAVDRLLSAAYGSVFDTITTRTFKNLKLPAPSMEEIQTFEKEVAPFFQKMEANSKSMFDLTATRDVLLPKLMSGEVKIVI